MITDQQLVRVTTIHGSKAFPQSISTSLLPIVTNSFDGQVSFPFEVSLISSLVINENNLGELKQRKKQNNCCYLLDPIKWKQMRVGASEMITVGWCTRQGLKLWKTLIIQATEFFLTRNLECIIVYNLKRKTAKA